MELERVLFLRAESARPPGMRSKTDKFNNYRPSDSPSVSIMYVVCNSNDIIRLYYISAACDNKPRGAVSQTRIQTRVWFNYTYVLLYAIII